MSSVVFVGSRLDIRCHLKDADMVLMAFARHNIQYRKKYTSMKIGYPSTITFVGVHVDGTQNEMSDLVADIHEMCRGSVIGNVYLMTGTHKPRRKQMEIKKDPGVEEDSTFETEPDIL